ncbi:MAG: hypothetical protein K2Q01_08675, partial [Rickettsiales bacterium]|nr:hypothetical protein [Rickettsiales bacterium]
IPRVHLEAQKETLSLTLEIHASENVSVPLPGPAASWRATEITLDSGGISPALKTGADGYVYVQIPRGVHSIRATGPLPGGQDTVNVSFLLPPAKLYASGAGWNIEGIQPDGSHNGAIQLVFTGERAQTQEATLEKNRFPGLVQVERVLTFGLSWQVQTTLRRLSPIGESFAVQIPLLPGEAVISADMPVKNGRAYVSMGPQTTERSWISQMAPRETLTLTAPKETEWPETVYGSEIWQLNVSNLWHVSAEGIPPVILPQTAQSSFTNAGQMVQMPSYAPLPGEKLTLSATRPEGVAGQVLTIDRSHLSVSAGAQALEATLEISLRASQGGQHVITLPQGAVLSSATLGGAPTSLNVKDANVTLPLSP